MTNPSTETATTEDVFDTAAFLHTMKSAGHDLEIRRRDVLRKAIAAHLDHGVSERDLALALAARSGPVLGSETVTAVLRCAVDAREARRVLREHGIDAVSITDTTDIGAPDTAARILTGRRTTPLGRDTAEAILAALATADLEITFPDHDSVDLVAGLTDREELPISRRYPF